MVEEEEDTGNGGHGGSRVGRVGREDPEDLGGLGGLGGLEGLGGLVGLGDHEGRGQVRWGAHGGLHGGLSSAEDSHEGEAYSGGKDEVTSLLRSIEQRTRDRRDEAEGLHGDPEGRGGHGFREGHGAHHERREEVRDHEIHEEARLGHHPREGHVARVAPGARASRPLGPVLHRVVYGPHRVDLSRGRGHRTCLYRQSDNQEVACAMEGSREGGGGSRAGTGHNTGLGVDTCRTGKAGGHTCRIVGTGGICGRAYHREILAAGRRDRVARVGKRMAMEADTCLEWAGRVQPLQLPVFQVLQGSGVGVHVSVLGKEAEEKGKGDVGQWCDANCSRLAGFPSLARCPE